MVSWLRSIRNGDFAITVTKDIAVPSGRWSFPLAKARVLDEDNPHHKRPPVEESEEKDRPVRTVRSFQPKLKPGFALITTQITCFWLFQWVLGHDLTYLPWGSRYTGVPAWSLWEGAGNLYERLHAPWLICYGGGGGSKSLQRFKP